MGKFKEKINIENILCLFIIMCPVLDMISFLFRNVFHTNFSPSTFTRPVIPAILMVYLFFKKDKNFKIKTILIAIAYVVYSAIHIYLFTKVKTGMSYSNEIHEAQYLVNYSFMILNLFLYIYCFKDKNMEKLKKSLLIAGAIYIVSIYISILTNTSSSTYVEEKIGYKGWFESGNSICSILLLSMYTYISLIKDKKYRFFTISVICLVGIFLCMLVGTRVGLYGFIITLIVFILTECFDSLKKTNKINKKTIIIGAIAITLVVGGVVIFGSNTIQRRKHLKDIEQNIVDNSKNEQSHITGSLLEIKEKIETGTLEENYVNEAQKQSILDLYNIANSWNVVNNDQRTQQLIYNVVLVKNQANPLLILFGNGYMANYRELVFEMEVPAILMNFGILGFILYLGPFLGILLYAFIRKIKNIKEIDGEFVRLFLGGLLAFALSFLSGYTFFSPSSAMMIIGLYTVMKSKV